MSELEEVYEERSFRHRASEKDDQKEPNSDPGFVPKVLATVDYNDTQNTDMTMYDIMVQGIIKNSEFDPKQLTSIGFNRLDQKTIALTETLMKNRQNSGMRPRSYLHPRYSYEALSYVWGASTQSHSVILNGKPFPVTDNLFAALRRLRRRDKQRVLWIDSMCINQSNIEERNSQVQMMGRIYNSAGSVIVWLGDANIPKPILNNQENAVARLPRKSQDQDDDNSDTELDKELLGWQRQILTQALTSASPPWWTRAWVTQELVLADDVSVAFGEAEVSWKLFESKLMDCWNGITKLIRLISLRENRHLWQYKGNIGETAHSARYCDATDPRDKVYSLLSLVKPAQAALLKPNYALTPEEVFTQATYIDMWCSVKDEDTYVESLANHERGYDPKAPRYPAHSSIGDHDTVQNGLRPDRFRILNWAMPSPHRRAGLPSWAVDFSDSTAFIEDAHLRYRDERWTFDGNDNLRNESMVALSEDKRKLTVRGLILDHVSDIITESTIREYSKNSSAMSSRVSQLLARLPGDSPYNLVTGAAKLRTDNLRTLKRPQWVITQTGATKVTMGFEEVVTETLGHWDPNENASPDWTEVHEVGIGRCEHEGCRCGPSRFFHAWNQCVGLPKYAQNYISSDRNYDCPWRRYCDNMVEDKARNRTPQDPLRDEDIGFLLVTETGFLGLARGSVRPGDVIALFYGADIPVVLRPVGDHYVYQGRAWINGIMMGELWNIYENPMLQPEDFVIW
ncbi:heterokaryon incompatibility protein-domain-containing protein [Hypoxylon sp. FL1284]|nr:heterokaryon incompatibility protein-domain-containing protein [Hypoxylon sp. FL1284]